MRPEDLRETGRLLGLHGQAVARGLIGPSEADRLRFVAAAEHARSAGSRNAPGLFAWLVRGRRWAYLTQADEDWASTRVKRHLYGEPRSRPGPAGPSSTAPRARLSEDAELVRAVRAASGRAGYRGDPFPMVRGRDPSWTRARWDGALAELAASGAGR